MAYTFPPDAEIYFIVSPDDTYAMASMIGRPTLEHLQGACAIGTSLETTLVDVVNLICVTDQGDVLDVDVWLDDEGLFHSAGRNSTIQAFIEFVADSPCLPLCGSAVVCAHMGNGDTRGFTTSEAAQIWARLNAVRTAVVQRTVDQPIFGR